MEKKRVIKAQTRDRFGKGEMHRLRREGLVPAVVYGPNDESTAVSLDQREISHLLKQISVENTIVQLEVSGKVNKSLPTLIREVQKHPYRPILQHVDFYAVPEGRKITVEVPIVLHGSPVGVRLQGGLIQHVLRDLQISVLPTNIPEHFVVNITELNIHESIHVADLPKGDYEILSDPQQTVITVVPPVVAKAEAAVEGEEGAEIEAAAEEPAEPEVIGRSSKESEEQ